jgi:hypothetical protein
VITQLTFSDLAALWFRLISMISVLLLLSPAEAQSYQTWPEISTYVKLNSDVRLYFIATTTRGNTKGTSAEIGPTSTYISSHSLSWKRALFSNRTNPNPGLYC